MAHFPIFIDIKDKKCLIIGGGKVAARKVRTLLRYGALVHVVSPEICPEIEQMLTPRDISRASVRDLGEEGLKSELAGAILVVAAARDREANHLVSVICREKHIPVNVVDAPSECTFLFPAVVKRGDISIGINTGGDSPIVSRKVREEVEELIPDYYGDIAGQLGDLRALLKNRVSDEADRRRILKEAAGRAFLAKKKLTDEEIREIIPQ